MRLLCPPVRITQGMSVILKARISYHFKEISAQIVAVFGILA
ncbi:hypothetical protein HBZC1_18280 [Helicobacter bizzozeronii CIII-1]|uniref:Uncharacterized protein n=1 Tax=Helicobacter bizzozeronii (strain CIII-1) TaxID=1002804 RepID=F8KPS4_HELBC|nr:hypothetical protein HBZC1_18280 [Helicobacter bizzozeronii CIII-1]